jgi:hypothetical protein
VVVAELQDSRRLLAKAEKGVLHGPVILFGVIQILPVKIFLTSFSICSKIIGHHGLKNLQKEDKSRGGVKQRIRSL